MLHSAPSELRPCTDALTARGPRGDRPTGGSTGSGMSFRDWRSRTVALRAIELLCGEHPVSIKTAAFTLGYNSAQAFGRFLKRNLNCSASEMRTLSWLHDSEFVAAFCTANRAKRIRFAPKRHP
jgi:Helix-turn-helix domain